MKSTYAVKKGKKLNKIDSVIETISNISKSASSETIKELERDITKGGMAVLPEAQFISKHKEEVNKRVSQLMDNEMVKKEFNIKNVEGLIKAYKKINENKAYKSLESKLLSSEEFSEFIKSLDPIQRYIFLKYVLPLIIASGMPREKMKRIISLLMKKNISGILNMGRFASFMKRLIKVLHIFGTPDGEAVIRFIKHAVIK